MPADLPPGCSQQDCDEGWIKPAAPPRRPKAGNDWFTVAEDICHQSRIDGALVELEAESDLERGRR